MVFAVARYVSKNIQPAADILQRLANVFDVSVDYLINGNKDEKAKASLKQTELLNTLKEIDVMPTVALH